MSIRETILSAKDRKVEKLHVPEWETDIHVRTLAHAERRKIGEHSNEPTYLAWLVSYVISDESGNRIFSDDDVAALQEKNGFVLDRITNKYVEMSGIKPEAIAALEKKL